MAKEIVKALRTPNKVGEGEGFHYPGGYVFGQDNLTLKDKSLARIKLERCLKNIKEPHGKILEIGCGGGKFIRSIKKINPGLKTYACDIDYQATAYSKRNGDSIICNVADVLHLPYKDKMFDTVIFFDLLEHVSDVGAMLCEINRILKDSGVLHCYVPCEANPFTVYWISKKVRLGKDLKKKYGGHIQNLTFRKVMDLVKHSSFQIKSVSYIDYFITQLFDFSFYSALSLSRNKFLLWKAHSSKDGEGDSNNLKINMLRYFKKVLAWISFYESQLYTGRLGAMGLHLTAQKVK